MLNETGFDLWADGYDRSVGLSDQQGSYPFAGYKDILNAIYNRVLSGPGKTVLDIGFGTGTLTTRLYEQGCQIYGQDFSSRMLELALDRARELGLDVLVVDKATAGQKMPGAQLCQGDFSRGLAEPLRARRYDAIIATYSLHHLTDRQKVSFLQDLLPLLNPGGGIFIGDVAFDTRAELEACRARAGDSWDEDEIYFVYQELLPHLPGLTFTRYSDCAGLLELRP